MELGTQVMTQMSTKNKGKRCGSLEQYKQIILQNCKEVTDQVCEEGWLSDQIVILKDTLVVVNESTGTPSSSEWQWFEQNDRVPV